MADQDCTARVALDLLKIILTAEQNEKKDRAYYLQLMRDCFKAANGTGGPIPAGLTGK
jgi:hypothetical protein